MNFSFPFWMLALSGTFWQLASIIVIHEYGTFPFHSCIQANQQKVFFLPQKTTSSAMNVTLSLAPGQPRCLSCCLRDKLNWHLLLGVHLLLSGGNTPAVQDSQNKASLGTSGAGSLVLREERGWLQTGLQMHLYLQYQSSVLNPDTS